MAVGALWTDDEASSARTEQERCRVRVVNHASSPSVQANLASAYQYAGRLDEAITLNAPSPTANGCAATASP
jgi:hypothetical protein